MKQICYSEQDNVVNIIKRIVDNNYKPWVSKENGSGHEIFKPVLISTGLAGLMKFNKDLKYLQGTFNVQNSEGLFTVSVSEYIHSDIDLSNIRLSINPNNDPFIEDENIDKNQWYNGFNSKSYNYDLIFDVTDPSKTISLELKIKD